MNLISSCIIIILYFLKFGNVMNSTEQNCPNSLNYYNFFPNTDYLKMKNFNEEQNDTDILRTALEYLAPSYFTLIITEIIPDRDNFIGFIANSDCLKRYLGDTNGTKIMNLIKYSAKSFPDYGDEEGCLSNSSDNAFLLLTIKYYVNNPNSYSGKFKYLPFISKGYTFYGLCVENSEDCTIDFYSMLEGIFNNKSFTLNGLESAIIKTFMHTKNDSKNKEMGENTIVSIFYTFLGLYLVMRILVWIFGYRFFKEKEEDSSSKIKDEEESSSSSEEEDEYESYSQTNTKEQTDDKKELLEKKEKVVQISKKNLYPKFYFFYKFCSFAESFKLLFKREGNALFKENDLYFIIFFRFLALFIKIMLSNFNYVIHNPSKEINNTNLIDSDIISLLKYASFSDIIFIMTESTMVSYKLMSFVKKYADRKEGPSFGLFLNFFLRVIPSVFIIIVVFLTFYFWNDIIMRLFSIIGSDYYSTKIQNMKENLLNCYSCLNDLSNLIPFYMHYHNFTSHTNTNESCFQFMIVMVNLFYCYCICILLTYISFKIKKKIFDIIISIIFLIGFFLPHEISCDYLDYFNINVLTGELCSITYTHFFIKYYFFGFLIGIALFYDNDITQDNSLQNSNVYLPFVYLKDLIGLLFKSAAWVHILIIVITVSIHILLSLSFSMYLKSNYEDNFNKVELSGFDKYLYLNEKTFFSLSIGIFLAHLYTYKTESKLKNFGNNIFVIFFNRIGYVFYSIFEMMINLIYSSLGLNYSITNYNLSNITFGTIFHITVWSMFLMVIYYIPIKLLVNKLLRFKKKDKI